MALHVPPKAPQFEIFENKNDYIVIIDNKMYKMNAIGTCKYLGSNYKMPIHQNKIKISFNNAPTAVQKSILGILERDYGY